MEDKYYVPGIMEDKYYVPGIIRNYGIMREISIMSPEFPTKNKKITITAGENGGCVLKKDGCK